MLKSITCLLAIVIAGPAAALSCMRPEIAQSFATADTRPEMFVIARGTLSRIGDNVPDGPDTRDPNMAVGYSFEALFEGHFASSDGFETERSVQVTVEVSCAGPWCGWDSLSEDGLYFLKRDATGGYVFEAGPCPFYFYDAPTDEQVAEIISLMS